MPKETLKCFVYIYIYLCETDLCEGLNLSGTLFPQEPLALDILTFIFWNNLSEIYSNVVTVYKTFLAALAAVAGAERSFSKLKFIRLFVVFHFLRGTNTVFNYINWK